MIDALTFALYGSVVRYDDVRRVEPIISSGMNEARVRFDFELEGRHLVATRVVKKTSSGGATTAEARLEQADGDVLASGAADVTAKVTELIGLDFAHFTRSVVLPQGEFAQFLHDKPGDRQAFLKALLDLGVLGRVREIARERLQAATTETELHSRRLGVIETSTKEAEEAARDREKRLGELATDIQKAVAELEDLGEQVEKSRATVEGTRQDCNLVAEIRRPEGLDTLSEDFAKTDTAEKEAAEAVKRADTALQETSEKRFALPKISEVERMEKDRTMLTMLENQQDGLTDPSDSVEEKDEALAAAQQVVETRQRELETLRRSHAAADLLVDVAPGDPCPVCHRSLDEIPDHSGADDVAAARRDLDKAKAQLTTARDELAASRKTLVRYQIESEGLEKRLTEVREAVAQIPRDLTALRESVLGAETALERVRQTRDDEKKRHAEAVENRRQATEQSRRVTSDFQRVRDGLARLGPPPVEGEDPVADWQTLVDWAAEKLIGLEQTIKEEATTLEEMSTDAEEKRRAIRARLEGEGIEPVSNPAVAVAVAHQKAVADLERITKERVEADEIRNRIIALEKDASLTKSLMDHLRANRFEGWLLAEALYRLVDGANRLLGELSSDIYSLDVGERAFVVIDHRNLDARRDVRTLSGGETFLVSLALALSLAEQLGEMASAGAARLDAIFLDEGFGTLDAETLETVASVVSELASTGRIVGLVTHVRDLADQMPVRYVVARGASGATVEREGR